MDTIEAGIGRIGSVTNAQQDAVIGSALYQHTDKKIFQCSDPGCSMSLFPHLLTADECNAAVSNIASSSVGFDVTPKGA